MNGQRWVLHRTNGEFVDYLAHTASVSRAMAQILINRDIKTPEQARAFLSEGGYAPADPSAMSGMREAVAMIGRAMGRGRPVFVHGDYDVDGLTSTAMLTDALRLLGLDARAFIPNRFNDGYGFNPPSVDLAVREGAGLIITVDCGITSFEAVTKAASMGMEVLITDHHEPEVDAASGRPRVPEEAGAVVNPKLPCPAGYEAACEAARLQALSGAGVVLKLIEALGLEHPGRLAPSAYLDLAALGTMADSVPLIGENRGIVKAGLPGVFEGRREGIRALIEVAGLRDKQLRTWHVPFTIVPRLNAAGRLDDATEGLRLLMSDSAEDALVAAQALNKKNSERQRIEEAVLREAVEMLEAGGYGDAIVIGRQGWHEGVIGIVASRIAERYGRPALILSMGGDVARGSGRSVRGYDLHEGLGLCRDILITYGGHRQAAGLKVQIGLIGELRERLSAHVAQARREETPSLTIDAAVELQEVTQRLVEELGAMEPFGYGNPEPVLGARGLEPMYPRVVGNNHLKMKLRSASYALEAIGYGMGGMLEEIEDAGRVDAAFNITLNEWQGQKTVQLKLLAVRTSAV